MQVNHFTWFANLLLYASEYQVGRSARNLICESFEHGIISAPLLGNWKTKKGFINNIHKYDLNSALDKIGWEKSTYDKRKNVGN